MIVIVSIFFVFINSLQCAPLLFSVEEENPVGTVVGSIAEKSGLLTNMSNQDLSMLQYKMVPNSGNRANLFSVVENSGNIKTTSVIDREDICKQQLSCVIKFDVTVLSLLSSFLTIYNIEISVTDKNDNVPTFPKSSITLEIREDDSVGTLYNIDSAQDRDVGINSIQSYEISPFNGTFALNVDRNLDQSFIVRVELRRKLDREVNDFYQFFITAKDGGSQQHIGTLTVNVKVLDANDNAPEFQSDYNISVKENFKVGDTILQLLATDKDLGENGRVFYRFSPQQSDLDSILQMFRLNNETGEIILLRKLNYGQQQSYKFYVDAIDRGTDPKWSQTIVTIRVEDDGNNPPEITLRFFVTETSPNRVNISEAEKVGTPIAIVNVQDSGSGNDGKVTCGIDNNNFELQSVSAQYVVKIKLALDRETIDSHTITVSCSDAGSPPMSSQKSFIVQLNDENDCIPKFETKYAYFAAIPEGSPVGTVVTQVTATDCDINQNAVIRYFLHADGVGKFVIDSITGVIKTQQVFDREINPRIQFRVLAVDGGSPPNTGTASVVLNITDINDNAPMFNTSGFVFHMLENQKPNSFVGKLYAFDIDEGENARLTYSMVDSSTNNLPFVVHPDGTINTTRVLNYEERNEYRFKIVVSDHGSIPKINENDVTIIVDDDNDHFPEINYPNPNNNTISIVYLEPVGTVIATVNATDKDFGINSELVYSFLDGNQLGIFNINNKGQIILASTHIIQEDTLFRVTISVKDKGVIPKETTQDVNIILIFAKMSDVSPVKDNSGNKYVIISAIVVTFTVLVSAVIIVIIILLRRNDKKLAESSKRGKATSTNGQNGTISYDPNHGDLSRKKKKEVSFSLEDDLDNAFDVSSSFSGYDEKEHTVMSTFEKPVKNNTLQFHQLLIQPDKQIKSLQKSHDTGSDTSAETIGSDSGRGGSESDMPSSANNPDDSRSFGYNNRDFNTCSSPFDGRPSRPFSDNFSHSAKNGGLTPRETFERKHKLNSSRTDNIPLTDRPKSDEWSPSYV